MAPEASGSLVGHDAENGPVDRIHQLLHRPQLSGADLGGAEDDDRGVIARLNPLPVQGDALQSVARPKVPVWPPSLSHLHGERLVLQAHR